MLVALIIHAVQQRNDTLFSFYSVVHVESMLAFDYLVNTQNQADL